jgi:hypothetical protein
LPRRRKTPKGTPRNSYWSTPFLCFISAFISRPCQKLRLCRYLLLWYSICSIRYFILYSINFTLENRLTIRNILSFYNKFFFLKLWGSAKPSNLKRIQILQSRILRKITKAPFYVSNRTLDKDLNIPFVHDLAIASYNKSQNKLNPHPNPLVQNLSLPHLPDDLKDCAIET